MNCNAAQDFVQKEVSSKAYQAIRDFIYQEAGIDLGTSKQMLVGTRLNKRLRHHRLDSFDQYVNVLRNKSNVNEHQMAIDLLATNETYFFREAEHFEILKNEVLPQHPIQRFFRVWSAACSSGEEAHSIGMVLDNYFGQRIKWEVFGSDISSRIIATAQFGNTVFASEAFQYNTDFLFSRIMAPSGSADISNGLLGAAFFHHHRFLYE